MKIRVINPYYKVNSAYNANQPGVVSGTLKKQGITYQGKVCIYERSSGIIINTVITNELGEYRFDNLIRGIPYMIVATDHNKQHNAVIQDMVVPK